MPSNSSSSLSAHIGPTRQSKVSLASTLSSAPILPNSLRSRLQVGRVGALARSRPTTRASLTDKGHGRIARSQRTRQRSSVAHSSISTLSLSISNSPHLSREVGRRRAAPRPPSATTLQTSSWIGRTRSLPPISLFRLRRIGVTRLTTCKRRIRWPIRESKASARKVG